MKRPVAIPTQGLSQAAMLLAAAVLAWQLGRLAWFSSVETLPSPPPVAATGALQATPDAAQVARAFGETASPARAVGQGPAETALPLRLEGVLMADPQADSRAFIAERSANGKVQSYRPGDEVPGGATLARVFADRVTLQRAGSEEILRFDKPGAPQASAPAPQTASATRNALGSFAGTLAGSPAEAIRQMGLRRTSQGYIVSITAPKEVLQRYGLQPGDRLVSINGQSLGRDLDADQQVMSQLQQSGSARVEVQRGDQTLTLEQKL